MSKDIYFLQTNKAGQARLNLQGELLLNKHSSLWLESAGLMDGMQVLDVGCGNGIMTNVIGKLTPKGEIVGLDISDEQIKAARHNTHNDNVNYYVGELKNFFDKFKGKFDIVYCRLFLGHVKNARAILKMMKSCLKETGTLVCEEATPWDIIAVPTSNAITRFGAIMQEWKKKNGLVCMGDHIYQLFNELNLNNVHAQCYQSVLIKPEEREIMTLGLIESLKKFIEYKLVTKKEADKLIDEVDKFVKGNNFLTYARITQIYGTLV